MVERSTKPAAAGGTPAPRRRRTAGRSASPEEMDNAVAGTNGAVSARPPAGPTAPPTPSAADRVAMTEEQDRPPQPVKTAEQKEAEAALTPEKEPPIRVLVIGAHPDDPEFGAGGTIATWALAGREIYYAVCTSGDKGTADKEMTAEELVALREREQEAAARELGVRQVAFLRFRDGELVADLKLREAIVRAIRRFKPDVVMTHDPATLYGEQFINHPDHRAVGTATIDAIYPSARDRLYFPQHEREGLEPHKVREVYFWGTRHPNQWVDVSAGFALKVKAVSCHETQVKGREGLEERMRENAARIGEPHGLALAEGFHRLVLAR